MTTAEQPFTDLVTAVEVALERRAGLPTAAFGCARQADRRPGGQQARARNGCSTPRQREIAALIAAGLSNKQIARRLLIEQATVKNHVHTILVKLGLSVPGPGGRATDAAVVRA